MKVVQMLQSWKLQFTEERGREFEKDKFYIMSDSICNQIALLTNGVIGIEIPFSEIYNKYEGQDLNHKKILMIRHGGGGDILFMTTGIKELKRKFPNAQISVVIGEQYKGLVEYEPEIDEIFTLPISLDNWNDFHYHLSFENLIENNPEATIYNAYDLFMKQMRLDTKEVLPINKIPKITISQKERDEVLDTVPSLRNSRRKIGLQLMTSAPIRNYPVHKFEAIIATLIIKMNCDIFVFGSLIQENYIKAIVAKIGFGAFNASSQNLRSSIILASFMDYFIAPDSMFIHIAAALNIPVLGIYGPFHSETRMKYFLNSSGIDVRVGCSPCFQHGRHPCHKGDPSPCFSLITPKIVIEHFEKLINNRGEK